jgi:L,D-transpeptidase-like protein
MRSALLVPAALLALAGCGAEGPAPPEREPGPAAFTVDRGVAAPGDSPRSGGASAEAPASGGSSRSEGASTAGVEEATAGGGGGAGAGSAAGAGVATGGDRGAGAGRLWTTAQIVRAADLRAAPGGRVVARVGTRTEFGSDRVLAVTGRRGGWLRVLAAERPNGAAGWIRARAVRLGAVDVSIHVDRSARELTVRREGRVVRRMAVAVGRPGTPTPTGRFAVTDRLRASAADSPYGCCALALSGHQTRLVPGWPGGDRLAIHGTQNPETVGHPASLGCMRARGGDIRALMRLVPLGTPVFVRA